MIPSRVAVGVASTDNWPQTLVCTKDRRTFERRMKQYEREIDAMRALVGLAPDSDAGINLRAKMQAATERAAKRKSAYR